MKQANSRIIRPTSLHHLLSDEQHRLQSEVFDSELQRKWGVLGPVIPFFLSTATHRRLAMVCGEMGSVGSSAIWEMGVAARAAGSFKISCESRRLVRGKYPPDGLLILIRSTNHNVAQASHHKGTAAWFFQGSIFQEWREGASLLWIHGKRAPCYSLSLSP